MRQPYKNPSLHIAKFAFPLTLILLAFFPDPVHFGRLFLDFGECEGSA